MRIAHASCERYGVGCHHWLAAVERLVVESVVTDGIHDLLLFGTVAREIDKEILVACASRCCCGQHQDGQQRTSE